jgi:hypothetical protein
MLLKHLCKGLDKITKGMSLFKVMLRAIEATYMELKSLEEDQLHVLKRTNHVGMKTIDNKDSLSNMQQQVR